MSTYTNQTDVVNNIEGYVVTDPFALERLIQRCESDLDRLLQSTGYPFLPPTQVVSLLNVASGHFNLTWNGTHPQSTPNENWPATAAQLTADLSAFTDVGGGNVIVLGSNPYTVVWNRGWSQTYLGALNPAGTQIPLLTVNTSGLVASAAGPVSSSVVAVQGRKINPLTDLDANQVIALSAATCAQVEYRSTMGEAFFTRAQYSNVKGPDFATSGKLPYIAPKAIRLLNQSGLLFVTTRATASRRRIGVSYGRATY